MEAIIKSIKEAEKATPLDIHKIHSLKKSALFSFGVIADVQYADFDDGYNFHKTAKRYYRKSLTLLKQAVDHWKTNTEISFVVQLGDLLDNLCRKKGSMEAAKILLSTFQDYDLHNLIGNHELYNFPRSELNNIFNKDRPLATPEYGYYRFSFKGWTFLVLDAYDFCTIQTETKEEALAYLKEHNANDVDNNTVDWTCGLSGLDLRFLPYNAGISQKQLSWIKGELEEATARKEKVIVLSHIPTHPNAACSTTLLWNYEELSNLLDAYSSTVVAYLAGHDHPGGYAVSSSGIHHKTFESPLEVPEGENAFATIYVNEDSLLLEGNGVIQSRLWTFPPQTAL